MVFRVHCGLSKQDRGTCQVRLHVTIKEKVINNAKTNLTYSTCAASSSCLKPCQKPTSVQPASSQTPPTNQQTPSYVTRCSHSHDSEAAVMCLAAEPHFHQLMIVFVVNCCKELLELRSGDLGCEETVTILLSQKCLLIKTGQFRLFRRRIKADIIIERH